jgi:hypothetical protein
MRFDKLYRYDELTSAIQALAGERPDLMTVESIGTSHEGRDIWLATVTNSATGPHHEKPALWVEANIHATEVTGSTAALHLLHRLVTGYGSDGDEKVTAALDSRTFYVVPRLNPDGVEAALADRPRFVRSSVRSYPRTEQQDGLVEEDIDGDGRILTMRIEDPNGPWKAYEGEPRLLIARDPIETGGTYYRLLPEGTVRNFDGDLIPMAPALAGLDMNRNFPAEWRPEGDQRGAGPYPTSEPEIRSLVAAVIDRPNVCGYLAYHTFSGVHLRPYSAHPDEYFPTVDLKTYKQIGKQATSITGYKAVSVFHDFQYDPKNSMTGASDDWAYDHLGVFSWTTEFWSPIQAAGITDYHFVDWWDDHPIEDDVRILQWFTDTVPEPAYVDWYEFDHPQLGRVELGGWDFFRTWSNPPPEVMEKEIAPHAEFALFHLLISPRLAQRSLRVERLDGDAWRVRLVVENTGWLPTGVTQKALERKVVRPIEAEITVPEGVEVVGDRRLELGQLAGRSMKRSAFEASDPTDDRARADWVVRAPAGTEVTVEARHQRAGVVRATVSLA